MKDNFHLSYQYSSTLYEKYFSWRNRLQPWQGLLTTDYDDYMQDMYIVD
jgi:hypothetical protein